MNQNKNNKIMQTMINEKPYGWLRRIKFDLDSISRVSIFIVKNYEHDEQKLEKARKGKRFELDYSNGNKDKREINELPVNWVIGKRVWDWEGA